MNVVQVGVHWWYCVLSMFRE